MPGAGVGVGSESHVNRVIRQQQTRALDMPQRIERDLASGCAAYASPLHGAADHSGTVAFLGSGKQIERVQAIDYRTLLQGSRGDIERIALQIDDGSAQNSDFGSNIGIVRA